MRCRCKAACPVHLPPGCQRRAEHASYVSGPSTCCCQLASLVAATRGTSRLRAYTSFCLLLRFSKQNKTQPSSSSASSSCIGCRHPWDLQPKEAPQLMHDKVCLRQEMRLSASCRASWLGAQEGHTVSASVISRAGIGRVVQPNNCQSERIWPFLCMICPKQDLI